jgi:hypothetical protein
MGASFFFLGVTCAVLVFGDGEIAAVWDWVVLRVFFFRKMHLAGWLAFWLLLLIYPWVCVVGCCCTVLYYYCGMGMDMDMDMDRAAIRLSFFKCRWHKAGNIAVE